MIYGTYGIVNNSSSFGYKPLKDMSYLRGTFGYVSQSMISVDVIRMNIIAVKIHFGAL